MNITIENVVTALKTIKDEEINVNIVDLGLIYGIKIGDVIKITMTFTSPTCIYSDVLINDVKNVIQKTFDVQCEIEITFTPMWSLSMLSEDTKFFLEIES